MTLIPKSLKTQLYKRIRDSFASENEAKQQTKQPIRDQMKLTHNKARQAAITNEMVEIVGGAEALNG